MKRIVWGLLLAVGGGAAAQGCDRCAGILGCTGDPRLSIDGQFIVHATGAAAPGVTVDFIRTGGVGLAADSIRAVTDGGGNFQLAVNALEGGTVTGDLSVRPPAPWLPYRITGQTFVTSDVRGEGAVLGRWVVDPYVQFVAELHGKGGLSLTGATVTIVRTGGVAITPDSFVTKVDTNARIYFPATAGIPGTALANVTVESSVLPQPDTLRGVSIAAQHIDILPQVAAVWYLGHGLQYTALVVNYDNGVGIAGATVQFRRTSGLLITPDSMSGQTNSYGFALLTILTSDTGQLVGDLAIHPPPPFRDTVFTGIRLRTYEDDSTRMAGVFPVKTAP